MILYQRSCEGRWSVLRCFGWLRSERRWPWVASLGVVRGWAGARVLGHSASYHRELARDRSGNLEKFFGDQAARRPFREKLKQCGVRSPVPWRRHQSFYGGRHHGEWTSGGCPETIRA